jgi:CubicO group peptidase (beta-lactamase class C family)
MKILRRFLPLWLLICAVSAFAQQPGDLQSRTALIERAITEEMARQAVPGLAVAIAKDGRLLYAKGFGYADLENKVPFTPQTVSRIGSVSKTFTATAALQLVEQGKLNLDAEVQTYVPSFPKKPWPLTVRQLLCHQSGIRHYQGNEFLSATFYDTIDAPLAVFQNDPLKNEPGTAYSYTTYGYTLLSKVVEAASGERFVEYLQRHILEPLGLKQTGFDYSRRLILHRARGYTKRQGGELENAPSVDVSNKWGGGGMLSTVEDLLRYGAAFDADQLLKPETRELMFTAASTRDGKPTAYGLGWAIATEQGRRRIEHTGGSVGATAVLTKYPDQGVMIAVLVNCDHYSAGRIKNRIAQILFEALPASR